MEQQPFYVGQEVVALKSIAPPGLTGIIKDNNYFIHGVWHCDKWGWVVDIGLRNEACIPICECGKNTNLRNIMVVTARCFAPIERTRTKYTIKEVEVAPAIRELEKCLS